MTRKRLYILVAIPAGYLPLSYLVLVCYVFLNLALGRDIEFASGSIMWWIIWLGICGTVVQWPFYILWALNSRELTFKLRLAWVVVIILLNMFAMPYFLYCKYRNRTRDGLIHKIRKGALRRFLEGSPVAEQPRNGLS